MSLGATTLDGTGTARSPSTSVGHLIPEGPPAATGGGEVPGVVASGVYAGGRRIADIRIDEAGEWSRRPDHVVWIGLYQPSMELLEQVQAQFGLHRLAIEDARHAHQRPKVERYGDGLFVVVRTAQLVEGRIALGETQIFVGRGYIVTVRHGASASYASVREKTESCPRQLAHGEDYILHAVLDFIVDNYRPVMETVMAEVEAIEDRVLKRELLPAEVERLYLLRRDLLRLRSAVVPLVEVCRKLEHGDMVAIDEEMQPLFRDVSDHLRGVQEEIDAMREVLAFAFEASLMLGQAQQTVITRRLAAWAAILAVPTAIAGIYGMNFEVMPELKWRYGYFVVLGGIFTACAVLYWRFRKNGWL
ncbi:MULTISPECIES: magnesium and cobalt transport protein CorA [Methylobacterium]|jgi:magnesium transporter|uniref:magnesium and cobalt transport protein CorA n=1 Tax=Methylobacterium TaxID=407 RepID=UPI0009ECA30E|nr:MULTISPECIES: magnesium and cobalt transport protein CorA [unclassified Methylobacterium]